MSDLRGTVVWVLRSETRALRPGPTCREGARDTAGLGKRGERPVHFAELTSVATSALVWAGRHYFPVFYRKASERGRLRPRPHRESPQTGGRRTLRTKCSEGLCAHSPQPLESLPGQLPAGTPLLESARVPRPSLEKRRGGGGVPRAGLCNPSGPAHSLGTPACPCPPWGGGGGTNRTFSRRSNVGDSVSDMNFRAPPRIGQSIHSLRIILMRMKITPNIALNPGGCGLSTGTGHLRNLRTAKT